MSTALFVASAAVLLGLIWYERDRVAAAAPKSIATTSDDFFNPVWGYARPDLGVSRLPLHYWAVYTAPETARKIVQRSQPIETPDGHKWQDVWFEGVPIPIRVPAGKI